jgi:hypothetical protein
MSSLAVLMNGHQRYPVQIAIILITLPLAVSSSHADSGPCGSDQRSAGIITRSLFQGSRDALFNVFHYFTSQSSKDRQQTAPRYSVSDYRNLILS